ncbi:type II toxin-antitoxin system death-on-curing family toxin [Anaerolineae bacterium CFX9]|jgi:death-on-curing protein|nr:type II toxin-antitoxin system death-on-curing family toxin [Anaerolineae bacterium CFX9]
MSFNPGDVEPITARDLININDLITQGDPRIRDIHLLDSAVRRPYITLFGEPQFPTLIDKAAALLHSLAYHHLFVDGNKRTAIRAVGLFLERNGLRWEYVPERDAPFVLEIAQGRHDPEAISVWLAARISER